MFNVARSPQFGLITDNPAAHVPKPNPQNERDRIASGDEWKRLLEAAAPHLQRILIVLYTLGPRRGELLRLEWPDIDMQRREITLRNTKNGETRTVPMTPEVYKVFTELWQERRLDTQRVFLYKDKPIRDVKTAFDKACRRAGIMNLRLHDLRHTASTNLRRAGVDATTAMKIVGHKSERMHRRYNTVEPEDLRRAISQLATYQTNTVITPGSMAAGTENVSACISSMRP
jgi:integrase